MPDGECSAPNMLNMLNMCILYCVGDVQYVKDIWNDIGILFYHHFTICREAMVVSVVLSSSQV